MTTKQIQLFERLTVINEKIKQLNEEIELLQQEHDKVSEELFNTIEPPKVKKKV